MDKLNQAFEAAKQELVGFLDDIASDWEADHADKSERWQEGETGQEAQERIDLIREWLDELPAEGNPAIDPSALQ